MAKKTAETNVLNTTGVDTATPAVVEEAAPAAPTKKGKPVDPNSRQSKARTLFQGMLEKDPNVKRGDVIKAFINDIGLTPNAAATYHQNFKKEFGLVKSPVKAEA